VSIYVIGDLHGCFKTFLSLLDRIAYSPDSDRLWLVGDLVNRGPASLETLQWVYENRTNVQMVLGNHDLHFMGRHLGVRQPKTSDKLEPLLSSPDCPKLVEWLCRQPLIYRESFYVLVHAGVLPSWVPHETLRLAEEAQDLLVRRPEAVLSRPPVFDHGAERRVIETIRILTLIRCCETEDEAVFGFTGPPGEAPDSCTPWFEYPPISRGNQTFLFGHWARLGYHRTERAICLDSSCAYGGMLSAIRLEDLRVFQVPNRES
jgi:bis(5'-nucleosyl)-tetraphosphatase (symmetrical)